MTLGITGYDAPKLKTGIAESAIALQTVKTALLSILENVRSRNSDSVSWYLDVGLEYLAENISFDDFDRMKFLTKAALPLQMHLNNFIKDQHWDIDDASILIIILKTCLAGIPLKQTLSLLIPKIPEA
jgi:cytochrome c peroxidase